MWDRKEFGALEGQNESLCQWHRLKERGREIYEICWS